MKKLLFIVLSFACVSLEAIHFQSSIAITPRNNDNEFLLKMQIEKFSDDLSISEVVASPTLVCTRGKLSQVAIGSENEADFLSIEVMIPEDSSQDSVQTSIFMKENHQIVLSSKTNFKLNK